MFKKKQAFIKIITKEGVIVKPIKNVQGNTQEGKSKKGMFLKDLLLFAKDNNVIVRFIFK